MEMKGEDEALSKLFEALSYETRVAAMFDRLTHLKHHGELENLAASYIVSMTQAVRLRTALNFIINEKSIGGRKDIRFFAAQALEYADEFTVEDVIASYKRVAKPEEH